jgi:hypothetical protein
VYSRRDETVCSKSVRTKRHGNQRGGGGGVADKEAYTVQAFNIISERHYFVSRCLNSFVGNVFGLHSACVCFPSTRKIVT